MARSAVRLALAALAASLLFAPGAVAAAQAARKDPVVQTLAGLRTTGIYLPAEVDAWARDWAAARPALRQLGGAERANLAGVVANTTSLAKRKLLSGRARPAFLTLRQNLAWFAEQRRPAPANATRAALGTQLVWQLYAGSGWQLQPLGTFGKLNALLKRRNADLQIRAMADQLLTLGVTRKGFLTWEYLFPWAGAGPGWTSGMAQATGMQALAGAAVRLADARLLDAAGRMLPAFLTPPPWGVREVMGPGRAHFLLYSQAPKLLVGNGFAQALLGLDHYRELTGDPRVGPVLAEGLAEARVELPQFDTGAWSLYYRTPTGPGRESDLSYHQLFTGFLVEMCARFADPFCTLEEHFAAYETAPVVVAPLQARARGKRLVVTLGMSKRGGVKVTVWAGDRVVRVASRQLLRGPERFEFVRPATRRPLRVTVDATSLTGVRSEAEVAVTAAPAP